MCHAVGLPDGDAATLFEHPTHPRGLLLSRTHAPAPRNGQTTTDGTPRFNPDAIDRAGQTRLLFGGIVTQRVLDKMSSNASSARTSLAGTPGHLQSTPRGGTQDAAQGQAGLAGLQGQVASRLGGRRVRPELDKFSFITRVTARQARSWRRQAAESRLAKLPQKTRLVPVALPAHAGFLQMAAEAIIAFNKRGTACVCVCVCFVCASALWVYVSPCVPWCLLSAVNHCMASLVCCCRAATHALPRQDVSSSRSSQPHPSSLQSTPLQTGVPSRATQDRGTGSARHTESMEST